MAYLQFNLPATAGDGAGAAVDVSTMGALKTIVVSNIIGAVNIEFSNEIGAPTKYASAVTFYRGGSQTISIAAKWMRVRVSGYQSGGAPNVDVGGTDDGATFANLAVTAGDGTAAATATSTVGVYKTVQVGGPFRGTVVVEVSEDNVAWAEQMTFFAPGAQTLTFAAAFMRVRRSGVPVVQPGTPLVNVGGTDTGGGGGGGAAGNPQAFQYVVTGAEPDLSELTIPLPVARPNNTYLVIVQQAGVDVLLEYDIPDGSLTTTDFLMSLSAEASASDIFTFYVVDPI